MHVVSLLSLCCAGWAVAVAGLQPALQVNTVAGVAPNVSVLYSNGTRGLFMANAGVTLTQDYTLACNSQQDLCAVAWPTFAAPGDAGQRGAIMLLRMQADAVLRVYSGYGAQSGDALGAGGCVWNAPGLQLAISSPAWSSAGDTGVGAIHVLSALPNETVAVAVVIGSGAGYGLGQPLLGWAPVHSTMLAIAAAGWSSSGAVLVYECSTPGAMQLVLNQTGQVGEQLGCSSSWSPSNDTLLVLSPAYNNGNVSHAGRIMAVAITANAAAVALQVAGVVASSQLGESAHWSPDGRYVAVLSPQAQTTSVANAGAVHVLHGCPSACTVHAFHGGQSGCSLGSQGGAWAPCSRYYTVGSQFWGLDGKTFIIDADRLPAGDAVLLAGGGWSAVPTLDTFVPAASVKYYGQFALAGDTQVTLPATCGATPSPSPSPSTSSSPVITPSGTASASTLSTPSPSAAALLSASPSSSASSTARPSGSATTSGSALPTHAASPTGSAVCTGLATATPSQAPSTIASQTMPPTPTAMSTSTPVSTATSTASPDVSAQPSPSTSARPDIIGIGTYTVQGSSASIQVRPARWSSAWEAVHGWAATPSLPGCTDPSTSTSAPAQVSQSLQRAIAPVLRVAANFSAGQQPFSWAVGEAYGLCLELPDIAGASSAQISSSGLSLQFTGTAASSSPVLAIQEPLHVTDLQPHAGTLLATWTTGGSSTAQARAPITTVPYIPPSLSAIATGDANIHVPSGAQDAAAWQQVASVLTAARALQADAIGFELIVHGNDILLLHAQGSHGFLPGLQVWLGQHACDVLAVSTVGHIAVVRTPSFTQLCNGHCAAQGSSPYQPLWLVNPGVSSAGWAAAAEAAAHLGSQAWYTPASPQWSHATYDAGQAIVAGPGQVFGGSAVCPHACPGLPPSGAMVIGPDAGYGLVLSSYCTGYTEPGSACLQPDAGCAFGSGALCQACVPGTICPGGFRQWAPAGYWTPHEAWSSPPLRCAEPSTRRCVGHDRVLKQTACGTGYLQGSVACSACAAGWYMTAAGLCAACPTGQSVYIACGMVLLVSLGCAGLSMHAVSRPAQTSHKQHRAANLASTYLCTCCAALTSLPAEPGVLLPDWAWSQIAQAWLGRAADVLPAACIGLPAVTSATVHTVWGACLVGLVLVSQQHAFRSRVHLQAAAASARLKAWPMLVVAPYVAYAVGSTLSCVPWRLPQASISSSGNMIVETASTWLWRHDTSQVCFESSHLVAAILAIALGVLYVTGLAWLGCRRRGSQRSWAARTAAQPLPILAIVVSMSVATVACTELHSAAVLVGWAELAVGASAAQSCACIATALYTARMCALRPKLALRRCAATVCVTACACSVGSACSTIASLDRAMEWELQQAAALGWCIAVAAACTTSVCILALLREAWLAYCAQPGSAPGPEAPLSVGKSDGAMPSVDNPMRILAARHTGEQSARPSETAADNSGPVEDAAPGPDHEPQTPSRANAGSVEHASDPMSPPEPGHVHASSSEYFHPRPRTLLSLQRRNRRQFAPVLPKSAIGIAAHTAWHAT